MKKILLVFFLMALGIVAYGIFDAGRMARGIKMIRVEHDFDAIHSALTMFKCITGAMPTTGEGLRALVDRPREWPVGRRWSRLMDKLPLDPWGREYRYTINAVDGVSRVKVGSAGPDGRDGTRDDQEQLGRPEGVL